MKKILCSKTGASLIEVLTTLGVITIGILVVVRVFSGGFDVMERSGNVTAASRLAEKEFERLRLRRDTLPLGITSYNGTAIAPGPPVSSGNLNTIRAIIGEAVRIPGPSLDQGLIGSVIGSIYEVSFAPISEMKAVYSAPMRRRVVDSDGDSDPWDWLPSTSYAIDYDAAKIAFRSTSSTQIYTISYSYWTADDTTGVRRLRTVNSVDITVPSGSQWIDLVDASGNLITSVTDFDSLDNRSDKISRAFILLNAGDAWSATNPYQYKILDGLLGRIAFNPIGNNYKERTPGGVTDLTAYIDYDVYDWSIISETIRVPDVAPFEIRTTIKNIKQANNTIDEVSGQMYPGLVPAGTSGGVFDGLSVFVVDVASGSLLKTTEAGGAVSVDFAEGILTVPASADFGGYTAPLAGRLLRVYYRSLGEWFIQPQKAYASYTRSPGTGTNFREYYYTDGDKEVQVSLLDAGKTFSVDYTWDDNGTERNVVGEVHRASDNTSGNATFNLNHTPLDIRGVRGVSMKVRVAWSEGKTRRNGNLEYKFQYYDLDGELTRSTPAG